MKAAFPILSTFHSQPSQPAVMPAQEYFCYGEKELEYLKHRDVKLAAVINRIGHIERPVITDLFAALVDTIAGQQISTKAHATLRRRMKEKFGTVTPQLIACQSEESLRALGLSAKKAEYIKSAAQKAIIDETFFHFSDDLDDEEVCRRLCTLNGVGRWTAEMLMTFSMQRPNVLSFGDYGIRRGLRMVYRHRDISPSQFSRIKRRLSPYASIAAFYFWAVAGGAIEGLTDPAEKRRHSESNRKKQ